MRLVIVMHNPEGHVVHAAAEAFVQLIIRPPVPVEALFYNIFKNMFSMASQTKLSLIPKDKPLAKRLHQPLSNSERLEMAG